MFSIVPYGIVEVDNIESSDGLSPDDNVNILSITLFGAHFRRISFEI